MVGCNVDGSITFSLRKGAGEGLGAPPSFARHVVGGRVARTEATDM